MGRKQGVKPRKNYTVRLSDRELALLELKAELCGMKMSQYIRELILEGETVDVSRLEHRRDIINQIARVGNNINQVAHMANATRSVSEHQIRILLDEMDEIKKLIREAREVWL